MRAAQGNDWRTRDEATIARVHSWPRCKVHVCPFTAHTHKHTHLSTHTHKRSPSPCCYSWCPFINAFGVLSMFYRATMSIGSGLTPLAGPLLLYLHLLPLKSLPLYSSCLPLPLHPPFKCIARCAITFSCPGLLQPIPINMLYIYIV